ncbi:MAG: glycosyltransferase [Deltaproteobacteria bacterium]|nr:glycosyltransferase [Deltaproteobacteria bacterium]
MKLLYLHHIALDSQKANIVQVLQMCHAFQQARIEVTLAVPQSRKGFTSHEIIRRELGIDADFQIQEYKKHGWRNRPMLLGAYWGVASLLEKSQDYDYCFARNSFLAELAIRQGLKTIYEEHDQKLHRRRLLNRWYMRRLLRIIHSENLVRMVVISRALADVWQQRGVPSEKMLVLHDGFAAADYETVKTKSQARLELGIELDKKIVMYVGSLYPDRGVEIIFKLAKTFPDRLFVIVGGPDENKRCYESEARTQGVENILFYGRVPHSKVKDCLFAADVLLMLWTNRTPTISICSPLKVFEYMAAGRVIVGTGFPTIREVLTDGENALLASPECFQELVSKLRQGLEMEYPNTVAENARCMAFEKYSWQIRVQTILDGLKRCCACAVQNEPCDDH